MTNNNVCLSIKESTHKRLWQYKLDMEYKTFDELVNDLIDMRNDLIDMRNVLSNSLNKTENGE